MGVLDIISGLAKRTATVREAGMGAAARLVDKSEGASKAKSSAVIGLAAKCMAER